MEFKFNINEYFTSEITKIDKHLLPDYFTGERRTAVKCTALIAEIMDEMGLESAKAQGLHKPITSSERLRNSDYNVYILIEPEANNGKGSILGLLKMGWKNLFIFDEMGANHEKKSLCVLDFYVYESSQRKGYGKKLFDYMLQDEGVQPYNLAIDKPSEKFLAFLYKHYGLEKIIPQSNNFVIFDGFFNYLKQDSAANGDGITSRKLSSLNNSNTYQSESARSFTDQHSIKHDEYGQSMYGRHAAYKPVSTIGKIVQQSPPSSLEGSKRSGVQFHHKLFYMDFNL